MQIISERRDGISDAAEGGASLIPPIIPSPIIGAALESNRTKLLRHAAELAASVPPQLTEYISDMPELLRSLACTIAVIGQVKAGKSSFINALTQKPGYLPTNVNPWTTAVTRMHFACAGAPADTAARVTFFGRDEWANIIEGGGRIRELTERFVPGFEVDLLKHHVNAMRRRCVRRLGAEFETLLSTTRDFDTISPDVLSEYICTGLLDANAPQNSTAGKYSDIVKTADLFFSGSPFAFPTTIIDTPGTNDPFLVRDEITRRSLTGADIHVVVLTARQALSTADLSLLQILQGLNRNQIILFINRIDELADVGPDVKKIVDDVSRRLKQIFPLTEMRIIPGSAHWAHMACNAQGIEAGNASWRKALGYAAHLGFHGLSPTMEAAVAAKVLLQCSGLSAVNTAISEMMLDSRAGHVVRQAGAALKELAQISPAILNRDISDLIADGERSATGLKGTEAEFFKIEEEVRQSERTLGFIHSLQVDAQTRTAGIVASQSGSLLEELREDLEDFVRYECASLRQIVGGQNAPKTWMPKVTALRGALERSYVTIIQQGSDQIADLERYIVQRLDENIDKIEPNLKFEKSPGVGLPPSVSLGALRQTIALDLGAPWWKRWWFDTQDGYERAADLSRLIREEFDPIIGELKVSGNSHLVARQSAALNRITGICVKSFEALRELSKARYGRLLALLSETDERTLLEQSHAREKRISELHSKIEVINRINRELEGRELGPEVRNYPRAAAKS